MSIKSTENLAGTFVSQETVELVRAQALYMLDVAQKLPNGVYAMGGLYLSWVASRWLSDRMLNNNVSAKFDWKKEIAVVTGGSGGIGAEVVKALNAEGVTTIVIDVLPLSYPKSKSIHYYKCDLTNYEELQSVVRKIKKEVGTTTIAIANAGICRGKPIMAASKKDIELTFGVNNLAMLWTAKTFLPDMLDNNHGHFLIVASQTACSATPGLTDYSASKSAAVAIYEGLDGEVRNIHKANGVRVSCVSPSAVDTKMFSGIKLGPGISALDPKALGGEIADIIFSGKSQNVFVPRSAAVAVYFRTLPDWVRVLMQKTSTKMMEDSKPHDPLKDKDS
ncbi:estradiol 17-beta-dehydrogenase 11 precursor [Fusarium tjaetaba]|uniref:Estradiol 17-beta-dehydrogenase 11 n=1 Tax=Fusarium tjaetaba TaxID=1567544 RepID=A0A8H5VK59_9HYPO|nr:estradiol 17-beta-dehydrogenase 11 precursor [Fusarium tjaetaba]KAF5625188.1 estradiol 17-beta-dehydrogenase 11 precursor [Fusarium tjaetaba]